GEDDEAPIYNPLNLPLGWDGKPIPYWLYKLHGLGVEYKCEVRLCVYVHIMCILMCMCVRGLCMCMVFYLQVICGVAANNADCIYFFLCQVCGNASYWGRKAFERHFQENKHALGMKCLGVQNTKHFHGVTLIAEVSVCVCV
ncbi:DUF3449 domain-containing protein, partial [archaeon]